MAVVPVDPAALAGGLGLQLQVAAVLAGHLVVGLVVGLAVGLGLQLQVAAVLAGLGLELQAAAALVGHLAAALGLQLQLLLLLQVVALLQRLHGHRRHFHGHRLLVERLFYHACLR